MKELKDIIAQNIIFYRNKKNLTQLELAKRIGKNSKQDISKLESGKHLIKINNLIDVAQALEVSVDAILGMESKEDYLNGKFYKLDSFDKNIINQTIDILYATELERNSSEN